MKKLIIAAAIVCAATISQAAAVGWSCMNVDSSVRGGDYSVFVVGMNGVTGAEQIKTIVEASGLSAADDYAFFTGGTVASTGMVNKNATTAPVTTITYSGSGTDTYQAFIFMQNADGDLATYTSTASVSMANDTDSKSFVFGNQATATANNKFDVAPEPTSGLLLLVGIAGLALRRRRV